jgi:hypothetical protein
LGSRVSSGLQDGGLPGSGFAEVCSPALFARPPESWLQAATAARTIVNMRTREVGMVLVLTSRSAK